MKNIIVRGGSWHYQVDFCRSAFRINLNPDVDNYNFVGLRVVTRRRK